MAKFEDMRKGKDLAEKETAKWKAECLTVKKRAEEDTREKAQKDLELTDAVGERDGLREQVKIQSTEKLQLATLLQEAEEKAKASNKLIKDTAAERAYTLSLLGERDLRFDLISKQLDHAKSELAAVLNTP